jgi:signal transduction histidine kinase/ActR/RegA family two-component response regulator
MVHVSSITVLALFGAIALVAYLALFYRRVTYKRLSKLLFSTEENISFHQIKEEILSLQKKKLASSIHNPHFSSIETLPELFEHFIQEVRARIGYLEISGPGLSMRLPFSGNDPLFNLQVDDKPLETVCNSVSSMWLKRFGVISTEFLEQRQHQLSVNVWIGFSHTKKIDPSLSSSFLSAVFEFIEKKLLKHQSGVTTEKHLQEITHDIRSPLHNVKHAIQLAQTEIEDPNVKSYLSVALQNIDTVAELTDSILDFSSRAAGVEITRPSAQSLFDSVVQVINRYSVALAMKKIIPSIFIGKELEVLFDTTQFSRVLSNIVCNAIKYSDSGNLVFRAEQIRDVIILSIADQGIGMTKEQLSSLFQPFTRYQRHLAEGAGLGLVVTKELLHANDASVIVDSEFGRGTTFTLTLKSPSLKDIPSSLVSNFEFDTFKKILLIEDNQDIRNSLVRSFEDSKIRIYTAQNFIEAESIIRFQQFEAVISDLETGQGDIEQFLNQLDRRSGFCPVLIISGKTVPHSIINRVDYVKKPFHFEKIVEWIQKNDITNAQLQQVQQ